jgi:hypothetical protein
MVWKKNRKRSCTINFTKLCKIMIVLWPSKTSSRGGYKWVDYPKEMILTAQNKSRSKGNFEAISRNRWMDKKVPRQSQGEGDTYGISLSTYTSLSFNTHNIAKVRMRCAVSWAYESKRQLQMIARITTAQAGKIEFSRASAIQSRTE